ncbi:hypothetical protein J2T56_001426 [Natronobacillus azotifigens]|uniref:DUF5702 domain-containing protein n=1 Tax=Natronobacillus azotifigens TaxID=472978 RepID=A0A9J6RBS1_9BACI|nr:DUF5702 domain-containing protein [Natronobacillus azotifigens]MCZ0703136.1 DUF5702 domain-containing protein [Natronobacillus azotifigens]
MGFFRRLRTDTKGAVSLFFIIITAIVFAFNAIFIDYARILAAEHRIEHSVQSAVRSALAGYNNDLRSYGLFGIDQDTAEEIFEKVLFGNMTLPDDLKEESFQFVQPTIDDFNVTLSRSLTNPNVLEHQILEEMKYKAPVEITKQLIERFSSLTLAVEAANNLVDLTEGIEEDFNKREQKIDETVEELSEILVILNDLKDKFSDVSSVSEYGEINNYNHIVEHYATYQGWLLFDGAFDWLVDKARDSILNQLKASLGTPVTDSVFSGNEFLELYIDLEDLNDIVSELEALATEEAIEFLEEEIHDLFESIKNQGIGPLEEYHNEYRDNAKAYLSDIIDDFKDIESKLDDSIDRLKKARINNENIKQIIEDVKGSNEGNYSDMKEIQEQSGTTDDELDSVTESIGGVIDQVDEYPYDDNYFEKSLSSLEALKSRIVKQHDEIEEMKDNFDTVGNSLVNAESIREEIESLAEKVDGKKTDIEDRDGKDFSAEEEEEVDADGELKELDNKLDNLSILEDIKSEQADYDKLDEYVQSYLEEALSEMEAEEFETSSNALKAAKSSMSLVSTMFNGIGEALTKSRNKLYINEYILMHFNSTVPEGGLTNLENYKLDNREVEYIIYGNTTPGMNFTNAIAQFTAFKFALNIVDAFADPLILALGHPLAILKQVLVSAIKETRLNVLNISSGIDSSLLPIISKGSDVLDLSYHEYLRIFMFMNPQDDNRLYRIAAMIDYKEKALNLVDQMTYIDAEVKASESLIFISNIADMFDQDIDSKRYHFNKKAIHSY